MNSRPQLAHWVFTVELNREATHDTATVIGRWLTVGQPNEA